MQPASGDVSCDLRDVETASFTEGWREVLARTYTFGFSVHATPVPGEPSQPGRRGGSSGALRSSRPRTTVATAAGARPRSPPATPTSSACCTCAAGRSAWTSRASRVGASRGRARDVGLGTPRRIQDVRQGGQPDPRRPTGAPRDRRLPVTRRCTVSRSAPTIPPARLMGSFLGSLYADRRLPRRRGTRRGCRCRTGHRPSGRRDARRPATATADGHAAHGRPAVHRREPRQSGSLPATIAKANAISPALPAPLVRAHGRQRQRAHSRAQAQPLPCRSAARHGRAGHRDRLPMGLSQHVVLQPRVS